MFELKQMLKCFNLYYHNTCKPTFPYQRLISIRHRLGILARRPTLSLELHKRSLVVLFFLVRIFETKKCSYLTKRKRGAPCFGVKVPLILSIRRKCCVADQRANSKGTWFNIVRCSVPASHSTSPPSNQANNTLSKYHVFVKQINPMRLTLKYLNQVSKKKVFKEAFKKNVRRIMWITLLSCNGGRLSLYSVN